MSISTKEKKYQLTTVSWYDATKKLALPFGCCSFLFLFSVLNKREVEFIAVSFLLCLGCVVLVGKAKRDGNTQYLLTNGYGITFSGDKKTHPWCSISRVEIIKIQMQVMAAAKPGFVIHFKNGETKIIDQRLEGYVQLYKELYEHHVPGAEKPLYLYKVDITGSKSDMRRSYHSIYFPDRNKTVKVKGVAVYD